MMDTTGNKSKEYSLWLLIKYYLWLGSVGYGGPLALMGYMRRDLVERKGWIAHSDFLNGVALSSLCPGPLATQLSIYIGWTKGRVLGATASLFAFSLPAFSMVLVLSILYKNSVRLDTLEHAFYGVSASVLAIVIQYAYTMSKSIVDRDYWLWGVFAYNFFITSATHLPIYWAFLFSGLLVLLVKAPPRFMFWSMFVYPLGVSDYVLTNSSLVGKIFVFFAIAGTVVFGGGFAIIPFLHNGVVQEYHWVTNQQFLDGMAFAMVTPGPVIFVVTFLGYLIAGIKGALAATVGVLLPCYLLVILLAPHFNRIAHHPAVQAFVCGITFAVAGGIAGTTWILAKSVLTSWVALGIFGGTGVGLLLFRKVPNPLWLLLAGFLGYMAH